MIEVEGLTKLYGDVKAVDDISFSVRKGEIVGFLGLNGAGKTTTMRMLTCFTPPSSGRASVAGYDVFSRSLEVRKHIGYLPERPPLYLDMTVRSYLRHVAVLSGVPREEIGGRIDNVQQRCGLTDVDDRLIGHLSKGYRQRVGIAQALVHEPEVLILDEPTSALDPRQVAEIRRLIRNLAGEHTILLSTHILPEITMTCERVIIINKGRIVATDDIKSLSSDIRDKESFFIELYDEAADFTELARSIPGIRSIEPDGKRLNAYRVESDLGRDVRRELAALVHQKAWGLKELRSLELSLEDIFLTVITSEESIDENQDEPEKPANAQTTRDMITNPDKNEAACEQMDSPAETDDRKNVTNTVEDDYDNGGEDNEKADTDEDREVEE